MYQSVQDGAIPPPGYAKEGRGCKKTIPIPKYAVGYTLQKPVLTSISLIWSNCKYLSLQLIV